MHAVSTCLLPAASLLWQSHPSVWVLTVVCRATFLLRPVESVLAPDQEEPIEHDDHWNDDPGRSLRVASDLVPMKPRAEVTVVGHAFAPAGEARRSVVARLVVGDVDKSIEVFCDRAFEADGALTEGAPFARMALLYERAAGGPGTSNPVGMRGEPDARGRVALPNLQPLGLTVASPRDYIAPVGFGPLAPGWPSRREKARRSSAAAPLADGQPLPEDLDPAYFNHAPRDQQVQILRDNERIVLEHLHPDHPRFVTALPGVRPRAAVERNGSRRAIPLRCDTLWIDTDRALCTLTWRAQVPLEHPEEEGRVVFSLDKRGRALARSASTLGRIQLRAIEDDTATDLPGSGAPMPAEAKVLPFVTSAIPAPRASDPGVSGLPFVSAAAPVRIPPPPPSAPPEPIAPPIHASAWARSDAMRPVAAMPMTVGQLAAQTAAVSERAPDATPAPAAITTPKLDEPPPSIESVAKIAPGNALQLVWFDPECLPRLRRKIDFQPILAALEERPLDRDLDDPALAHDARAVEDRRDVFEVLARGDAADEARLDEAIDAAVRDDGKLVPPFLLIAGELRFPFDEIAALQAAIAVAGPFAAGDDALKAAIADARDLARAADPMCPSGVYEALSTRIHEAFAKLRKAAATGYLGEQTERVLLERRCYQRRDVLGATHLRALFQVGSNSRPWPIYLPESLAKRLPMFARFQARVLADVGLQEDQNETHALALRAMALARIAPRPARPSKG